MDYLKIRGARQHNLKNISVDIPRNRLVVFTGLSGSGKSSLAIDTIYAEGQRRYVESLSSYARQFLGVMDKPDIDSIEGLSPAISITQKSSSHNPRSTVGTITEIYDYLRVLFARIGHPHCPTCGTEIAHQSKEQIVEKILQISSQKSVVSKKGTRLIILAPIVKDRKGEYSKMFDSLRQRGFFKARIDGEFKSLQDDFVLIKTNKHTIEAEIGRITLLHHNEGETSMPHLQEQKQNLSQMVEQALTLGEGTLTLLEVQDASFEFPETPKEVKEHLFSEMFACPKCNISLPELEPRNFSFNTPHGACPTCSGLGTLLTIDPELIIAPSLTIAEGAIIPYARMLSHESWYTRIINEVATAHHLNIDKPFNDFNEEERQLILYGTGEQEYMVTGDDSSSKIKQFTTKYEGIIPNLERRYRQTDSEYIRTEIEKFMRLDPCPTCNGLRLKPETLAVTINELNIAQVSDFSIRELHKWLGEMYQVSSVRYQEKEESHNTESEKENNHNSSFIIHHSLLSPRENLIATPILKETTSRLQFLIDVGLDYLTLSRSANTLAGGEMQRIRLASQIGSGLTGVLYILDEPTIGLHQRDNTRLINTLKRLRDLGNTVIVVEHDQEMIESADYVLDFGPGAGEHGGQIVAMGTPEEIIANPNSVTGKYLSGNHKVQPVIRPDFYTKHGLMPGNKAKNHTLTLVGAKAHNLKNLTVNFPLGKFVSITGVSGSGKSTVIHDT